MQLGAEITVFERPHHQRIAHILFSLNADILTSHQCWFGGGTSIALRYGEYRESIDMDFMVSNAEGYRELRHLLTKGDGIGPITRIGSQPLQLDREIRADQYGIRTQIRMDGQSVKFEIVREARISFEIPRLEDSVCGVQSLTNLDLAASKILSNSDRHADDGVFSRDIIDLAMMGLKKPELESAIEKSKQAYGPSVVTDLARAIERLEQRQGWLERCMRAMDIQLPKAVIWEKIRRIRRNLKAAAQPSPTS
jgi:Nucleotidyl transferase AbiEii toxin, Type IV TA system